MFRTSRLLFGCVLIVAGCTATSVHAEHTRVTYPSAMSVEVLGRAAFGSLNFDQVFSDDLAAGLGLGFSSLQTMAGADAGKSATFLPFYANYYFMREASSVYFTMGATVLLNSNSAKNLKANPSGIELGTKGVLPHFGVGFENRTDTGFLFRVTAYGILGETLKPWVGGSFGICF